MSKLKYLIDGKADEQFENMLWCFGSSDPDSDDSGGDSGSTGGSGDSAFYDNERPGLTNQNRPVGGTTNVVQGTSQPGAGRDPVMDIVTMGRPMTEAPAVLDTPLKRDIAESMFQEFAANLPPAPVSNFMAPTFRDVSVGEPNLPPSTITDLGGEVFDTSSGQIIPSGVTGMEDEYDPYAGTGNTAMDVLGYDTTDQTNTAGFVRPFAGLTRAQQANLEGRDDFVARNILAAQTPQPSGIPTTNLTGIFTYGDSPEGDVRGYSDFGPNLPFFGQTQVYTGFGENPYAPPAEASSDETVPPVTNPMTGTKRCPDGYTFDEDLQACRRKTKRELRGDADSSTASGDMFYRRTSLDDAPANLPGGFNFADANRAFTQSYAFRPSFYRNPMDTTGFTKLL